MKKTLCLPLALAVLANTASATILQWFTADNYAVGTAFNHNVTVVGDVGSGTTQVSDGTDIISGGPDNGVQSIDAQPYGITIAAPPVLISGRPNAAYRFEVRRYNFKYSGHRAEIAFPHAPQGGVYWYAWSVYVPSGSDEPWDEIMGQAHGDDSLSASPPWAFGRTPYIGSTRQWSGNPSSVMCWNLDQRGGTSYSTADHTFQLSSSASDTTTNTWVDWVVQINWARDNTGFLNVWQNGTQVVALSNITTDFTAATVWPYFKFGIYKWPWKQSTYTGSQPTRVAYYQEIKIGDALETYATMAPRRGTNTPPPAPTGLTATAVSNTQINLSWTASTGATSYNVLRSNTSGGPYTTIAIGETSTTYGDSGLTPNTTYYYVVQAVNSYGTSGNSNEASATTAAAVPTAPTNLTATALKQSGKIKLNWIQSTSANLTSNKVYRSTTSGGPYSLVTTLSPTTTYTNSGLTSGTTYYYVVTAVNGSGESVYSNQASAKSN